MLISMDIILIPFYSIQTPLQQTQEYKNISEEQEKKKKKN